MYQASSQADGIFSANAGLPYGYGERRGAYADGSLGEYQYGQQTSSYADGSLGGCSSCSGLGSEATVKLARYLSEHPELMPPPGMPASATMAAPVDHTQRNLIIGAVVLTVGAVAYLALRKKKS